MRFVAEGVNRLGASFDRYLDALPWVVGALVVTSCVHEAGHAWAAWRLGDRREAIRRRISPLSLSHISWLFTVLLPSALFLATGMLIGGARPVMVSTAAISPKKMVLVAIAGPMGNFLVGTMTLAAIAALIHGGVISSLDDYYRYLHLAAGLSFFLGLLNLLPIPPLDGSRVLAAFLPERLRNLYYGLTIYAVVAFFVVFFYLGRQHPEKLAFIDTFFRKTVPGWTAQILEWIN